MAHCTTMAMQHHVLDGAAVDLVPFEITTKLLDRGETAQLHVQASRLGLGLQ